MRSQERFGRSRAAGDDLAPASADIPAQSSWKLTKGGAYVHICANETIGGVEFKASDSNSMAHS